MQRVVELSAQIHAATAELAREAAALDDAGSWFGTGVLTCAHWLSINTGVDVRTGSELIRVGHALKRLPRIAGAFAAGRLSFDKVRALTRVATPEDDALWLEMGLSASGSQLTRLCRAVRRALEANEAQQAEHELAKRELHAWWRDDGMLHLVAVLPREDGAVLMAAIEAAAQSLAAEREHAAGTSALDPGADVGEVDGEGCRRVRLGRPQLRADALVRVSEEWVASVASEPVLAPTRQVVVHIDSRVVTDRDPAARLHLEDGPWLSMGAARWMSCDADVVSMLERDGTAVDVGRVRRLISPRLRLALQARDQGCRFPGCGTPARRTEGHHVRHWESGGPTDLDNLVSLCRFHHRRHHDGAFAVHRLPGGGHRFELSDGTPLVPVMPRAASEPLPERPDVGRSSPRALEGGAPCAFAYAVGVIADACVAARR